jgi:hypothetical protein
MKDEPDSEDLNLSEALGADSGVSTQCFAMYIPNKDKNGIEFPDQRRWVLEARQLLGEINGGVSVMPAIEGGWMNDDGVIIWENPVVVYSQIKPEPFVANLARVRSYLHRMGRETNQGEVVFEFGDRFYRIRKFDPA